MVQEAGNGQREPDALSQSAEVQKRYTIESRSDVPDQQTVPVAGQGVYSSSDLGEASKN